MAYRYGQHEASPGGIVVPRRRDAAKAKGSHFEEQETMVRQALTAGEAKLLGYIALQTSPRLQGSEELVPVQPHLLVLEIGPSAP